jgi:hypothetical protein
VQFLFVHLLLSRHSRSFLLLSKFFVHFLLAQEVLFISFAPPKEMNQRKGGRKCQLKPFFTLATHSHVGATKKASVHTISGIASAPSSFKFSK